ncbi:hypothetical protein ACPDZI_09995 [Aeromonas oralensis]|uniref:hypothetical protein n=1 Tax=Aeromonas oralensis TaxID=3415010 RepID=UPI003D579D74
MPPLLSKSTAYLATANAEACDPTYYTAVIWPKHDRGSGHGTVQSLKTEVVNGKLKPIKQFAYLGHAYPLGLGVTDEPNPRIRK